MIRRFRLLALLAVVCAAGCSSNAPSVQERERLAEQEKLYNKGEPDKLGPETRNHQLYLDRLTELRAGIQRYSNDVAGLEREISRLPAQ